MRRPIFERFIRWLRQETSRRTIPHYKLGRTVRFRISEIDQWLLAQSISKPPNRQEREIP
jgi:hypothetical protein